MTLVNLLRGKVTLRLLNPCLLYVDMTVLYDGKPYSLLRTFLNNTVEIFHLHTTKIVHLSQLTFPVIEDNDKVYHFDREEIEKIVDQDLFGKMVSFASHIRMVTAEYFEDNGRKRIRGTRPYELTSAKIVFPQPVKVNEPDMWQADPENDTPTPIIGDELSFEVNLPKSVIPMGTKCEGCPYLHQLSFPYPGYALRTLKIPYCLFLKQGSVPNRMKDEQLSLLAEVLGQTIEDITEIDTGLLGLQLFANGVKECNVNTEDNFEFPFI